MTTPRPHCCGRSGEAGRSRGFHFSNKLGHNSCWQVTPNNAVSFINTHLLENKNILQGDRVPFHSCYLSNIGYFSCAIFEAFLVNNKVNGSGHLLPYSPDRQIHPCHEHHSFQAKKHIRGLLACPVVMEPSCPVFIACNMSSASPPRTSPTTILSGRIRRALITDRESLSFLYLRY